MHSVLDILYEMVLREFTERVEELKNPTIVFVTDLTSCSHKRVLRLRYPSLAFSFEPSALLGSLVHMGLQKVIEGREGWIFEVRVEREITINGTTYKLVGRADMVKIDEGGKPITVVEVKTSKSLPSNAPLEHHVLQLRIYMELLEVEDGLLLYVTPERIVEFPVERAPIDLESLVEETVNDRVKPRYSWECKYCVYRKICPYAIKGE